MNKHQPNSLIALNPEWRWQDFTYRCQQISQQLQQDNIQSAAFWFEDAATMPVQCLLVLMLKPEFCFHLIFSMKIKNGFVIMLICYLMTINSTPTAFHKLLIKKISSLINIVKPKFG